VTNSRDTQEVPVDKGKLVLKIMHGYKHSTSIFDDFSHYEKRQEEDVIPEAPPKKQVIPINIIVIWLYYVSITNR